MFDHVVMAASMLEDNLQLLQLSLTADASKKEQADSIVLDLRQICMNEISEKEIDVTCSKLFDKGYGLLVFLNKAVTNDELQVCKAHVLELLAEFVEKVGKKIIPYAVDIKDVCVSLFSRDRYAKVKNAAMPVLIKVLELTVGSSIGEKLQVDKLITKFFGELTKAASKVTATVREKIYILLGVIAEVYPTEMSQYADRLKEICIGAIKTEMNSKTRKPELSIISGCLEALTSCLVHFTESVEEESERSYEIFKYARNAIDPKVELTRYDVPRSGLKLFARHSSQFSQYLIQDYKDMYSMMYTWSHHKNSEMVSLGMMAIEAFLTQVCEVLKNRAQDGDKSSATIFKYFVCQLREILNSESSSAKELSLAIKCYGVLAGPCRCFMKPADVQFMFEEMLTKTDQQFLGQTDDFESKLFNLSSYLQSLASIVREIDTLSETYAMSLEYLMVLMLENIPNIHPSHHFICRKSILWLLLAVMSKGATFRQVLSGFVYQALIRTCSYQPVIETENEGEISPEEQPMIKVTYKNFMETWCGLLDGASIKDFAAADISLDTRSQLTDAIYSEIITAVLKILDKLDLTSDSHVPQTDQGSSSSTANDDTEVASADPLLGVLANKPKDFQIFINLVDFCRDLLLEKCQEKFCCWMYTFTYRLILMSSDNPLASGFYKLLSVSMKIANRLNYFQNIERPDYLQHSSTSMEVDSSNVVEDSQKHTCFFLIKKFSKEVLARMKQYRDELLASCLVFILSLPQQVIFDQMSDVVQALQVTLNLGLSYLPLAMVAMDALEFWSSSLPGDMLLQHYSSILPCLDSFLRTTDQGAEDVNVNTNINVNKSKSGNGWKKLSVRLIRSRKYTNTKSYQSQLTTVKQRIIRYLGQLGGSVNWALLAQSESEIARKAIKWDTLQHLKFDMPFVDMKPTICLDPFLPHVTDLALTCSDRQTKVAACELLHSMVLYCIGRSVQIPPGTQRHSMAALFQHIVPALLKLACDVELVARQLFEPLTMQLIHWFTINQMAENEETMTLLDGIYDGIIQQTNTALRDFSAKCMHEFFKWSIKQTSTKKSETNPANAKSVLKRLYSYALHPSPFKRLGAALAFNNIYTLFREEEPLVNMFTFELLDHFVESLAMAHLDEKSLGTQEQCCKALEHLGKIIKCKANLLSKPHKNRTEPRSWSNRTLEIAVRWLTRQCGRPQTECRHACMELVCLLSPQIVGIKRTKDFFQACLKGKGHNYWIQRFEGGGHAGTEKHGIEGASRLIDMADTFSLQTVLLWFDNLLAALDCYTWVFGESLLSPEEIFANLSGGSVVFSAILHFLDYVATADLGTVASSFQKQDIDLFSPKETDDFSRAKCTVIVRLMDFLTIMLTKYKKETIDVTPKAIWSKALWGLILSCVVRPGHVGFNMGDVDIMKNLPQVMSQTLNVVAMSFKDEISKYFQHNLTGDKNVFNQLPIKLDDESTDFVTVHQMLSGHQQLQEVNLLLPCLPGQNSVECARKLLDNVHQGIVVRSLNGLISVTLTPTAKAVAQVILKLSMAFCISPSDIVSCIMDNTKVTAGFGHSTFQLHGDLFFSLFKPTLSQYCVSHIAEVVPLLMKYVESEPSRVYTVLTSTIDHVTREKELRKRKGSHVLNCMLAHWTNVSEWWGPSSTSELQTMALGLTSKLLLIDSKFASSPEHKSFNDILKMYQKLLTNTNTSLSFKCRVLDLLHFFACVPDPFMSELKHSLEILAANSFPLRSSELTVGSPKYLDYINALDKILNGLQLSGSLMLLEYVISIFCKELKHAHEDRILAALAKFTQRLPRDKQKSALDVPYNIFLNENFTSEIRRATIERVCLPIMRLVNMSVVVEFFSDHIVKIKELIDVKLLKSSENVLEGQLITRICCFHLLEAMYLRLTKDEVVGMNSTINSIFSGGNPQTGKELTSFVSKQANDAKSEDTRGESILLELRRQYHCAAYNLMVAFISRTQSDVKFYTAFLFDEKENKGQFLLENLIDKEKTYAFPVELTSPLKRKKMFVTIHKDLKEEKHAEDNDTSIEESSRSYHLASQYLADSSLSEDVSQYFPMSAASGSMSSNVSRARRLNSKTQNLEDDLDVEVKVDEDFVELEMDSLNQHECMSTMIAVIKHMDENKITPDVPKVTPDVPKGTATPPMPSWMEKLHGKMCSSQTHHNIKLFIAKLATNTANIFQPYACHWLQPLTQLIVCGPLGSGSINYFIVDLVITMLSWHKNAIPKASAAEDKAMASSLVHFIIKNVYHESRPVFRNNLEMLKTILECWQTAIDIPYQEIYGQLSNMDPKVKDNSVGIQVLAVVIASKFPPYSPVAPVDRDKFLSKVASHMMNSHKTVYAPAAEVCGMIFKYLAEKEDEHDGNMHSYISDLMMSLYQSKPGCFITCVHLMHKHYPFIVDRFLNKLLFILPNLHGEFRTLCLEMLCSRIDKIDNVFQELKSKEIMVTLAHRAEATQLVSLQIVKAILGKLTPGELIQLMPLIVAFWSNPSTKCRNVMYDILIWVYDNYREKDSNECHEIIQQTKDCLLKGLGDDDLCCRLQVQNFWSSETRLPVGTLDRLVAMLEAMYSPVTEQQYLSYATNLLLEMTSKSPDYHREIFEHPLSECKFSNYIVKSSWRQRHAAMTPLFATQATQSDVDESADGIRATQDVQQFTQTVEAGAQKGPFNWLTQSSIDTYSDSSSFTMHTRTQSSLLFTVDTNDTQRSVVRKQKPGPVFGSTKMSTTKQPTDIEKTNNESREIFRLKRRFLKDQEQSHIYFAKQQTRLKQMREVAQNEQKIRRENQVTMYRKYRAGELPDIQIKYSYIIAPLQALAQRDSTIAKLLFTAIFRAIFAKMDDVKTDRETSEIITQINNGLNNVLSQSSSYYPPFIGCILNILYDLRFKLKVDVTSIGSSAVFSKLQPLGIVVLEEGLILHDATDVRAAKRSRMETPVSKDVSHWIELSRLYKSINEYDILLGIFSEKIGTKSNTQKAIEAEARGDYAAAQKLYEEAMNCTDWPDGQPLDAEVELWQDCRMECLQNLSQWNLLESAAVGTVDDSDVPDISKVWNDIYLQDHFLPFIVKSKVKLLLLGDTNQQSLLTFIDASMKILEQKSILENKFCEAMALMYLWQQDYDRARHYSNTALDGFLQEWCSTDSLMSTSRTVILQKLQCLIEMNEFLEFVSDEGNFRTSGPSEILVELWRKRTPDILRDPVIIWDDVVTNRCVYLDQISKKLQTHCSGREHDGDMFEEAKIQLKLIMADSCRAQNNFKQTLSILKSTHSVCKHSSKPELLCEWTHLYASMHHKKIQTSQDPCSENTIDTLLTTLKQLDKIQDMPSLQAIPHLARKHHILAGQGCKLLALMLHEVKVQDSNKIFTKLKEYLGNSAVTRAQMIDQFISDGFGKLKASLSIDVVENVLRGSCRYEHGYLATAKYCDSILRWNDEEDLNVAKETISIFPETTVVCMLKAMKLDSMEARQRFPRLLQILDSYPETQAKFIANSKDVPCWMFILWISQMLAILDKPLSPFVHHILEQIATFYPQAIVYALTLSEEGYTFGSTKQDKVNKDYVHRLHALTGPSRIPLAEKFVASLECFGQPDLQFKDAFDEMIRHMKKGEKVKARDVYLELYKKIMDYRNREKLQQKSPSDSGDAIADDESLVTSLSVVDIGDYARKFADKFKVQFDKIFGPEGKNLTSMSVKDLHIAKMELDKLFKNDIINTKGELHPPGKLSEYSKWMANFNPNTYGRNLELPGQYMGFCKPLPEYHVKISGFDPRVKVMSSLRKPKRVTIRGNDERDYHFLVKSGEDLRQDQRIEQLFYMMNQTFDNDPACKQRKLFLKTYKVIPMTPRVGLIEWVSDTIPLKDFLHNACTEEEQNFLKSEQGPNCKQYEWLKKVSRANDNVPAMFEQVFIKYNYTQVEQQLNIIQGKVPWDISRRAFQQLSTSPGAFHVLRSHCIQTHAVLSICQYILGIGDRHLSNFMVNKKTGGMVGIDFGHAFGSATQFLPIPELMPFRLTRQIRNLMLPLNTKGLIESTMMHVLQALRSDTDLLLSVMDIFINEPSLDWLHNADKQAQALDNADVELNDDDDEKEKKQWYPKEKICFVKRKLKGANPAFVTRDELKLGHGKKPVFKDYEKVLLGIKDKNIRAQLPEVDLTVKQQIAALIDQATDPNILGRTYTGWEPWM